MDICVLIGGDETFDQNQAQEQAPEEMIKLLTNPSLLENTYANFLKECKGYIDNATASPALRSVYTTIEDATKENTGHDHYSIGLLNRSTGETGEFSLQDIVRETSGDFLYTRNHNVGERTTSIKTLEMYIFQQENGG